MTKDVDFLLMAKLDAINDLGIRLNCVCILYVLSVFDSLH